MNWLIAVLCASLLGAQANQQQAGFSEELEKMWLRGEKQKVGEIGLQRLARDPNDVVGLLLKLEYEMAFVKTDDIPATLNHIEEVGDKITSPNFKQAWPKAKVRLGMMREVLRHYTKEQVAADRKKASITGKPMLFLFLLEAAEMDGLHQMPRLPAT